MRVVVFGRGDGSASASSSTRSKLATRCAPWCAHKGQLPFQKSTDAAHRFRRRLAPLVAQTVVRGADVVVTAIGNRTIDEGVSVRTEATRQIIDGMNVHGVPRLLARLVGWTCCRTGPAAARRALAEAGSEHVFADHRGAWQHVEASGIDYTLACPARS